MATRRRPTRPRTPKPSGRSRARRPTGGESGSTGQSRVLVPPPPRRNRTSGRWGQLVQPGAHRDRGDDLGRPRRPRGRRCSHPSAGRCRGRRSARRRPGRRAAPARGYRHGRHRVARRRPRDDLGGREEPRRQAHRGKVCRSGPGPRVQLPGPAPPRPTSAPSYRTAPQVKPASGADHGSGPKRSRTGGAPGSKTATQPCPQGSPPSLGATSRGGSDAGAGHRVGGAWCPDLQPPGLAAPPAPQVGLHRCHRLSGSLRRDRPGDHQPLDLRRALEDRVDLGVPGHPLTGYSRVRPAAGICMAWPVTLTAVSPAKSFDIGPRRFSRSCPPPPSGRVPDQEREGLDRGGHVGELEGDALVLDDRLAELLAGLRVVAPLRTPRVRSRSLRADRRTGALGSPSRRCRGRRPRAPGRAGVQLLLAAEQGNDPAPAPGRARPRPCAGTDAVLVELLAWLRPFVPGGTTNDACPRVRSSGSTTAVTTCTSAIPPFVAQVLVPLMTHSSVFSS